MRIMEQRQAAKAFGLEPLFAARLAEDEGTGAAIAAGFARTASAVAAAFAAQR